MTATCRPASPALGTVSSQFAEKESTFWNSTLQITGYDRVHEIAFRPWQSDNIPRRYCAAIAMLTDGKPRPVYFSIVEDGGFASFTNGVEFCVVGLDRNWALTRPARPRGPDLFRQFGSIARAGCTVAHLLQLCS